jgi:hypothetical protein
LDAREGLRAHAATMQEGCIVVRILPGREEAARELVTELSSSRRGEQDQSARRIGARSATWSVSDPGHEERLVGVIGSADLGRSLDLLAVSLAPHDLWFKRRFEALTGVDLNERRPASLDDVAGPIELRSGPVAG